MPGTIVITDCSMPLPTDSRNILPNVVNAWRVAFPPSSPAKSSGFPILFIESLKDLFRVS
jgi:hypothetical protein